MRSSRFFPLRSRRAGAVKGKPFRRESARRDAAQRADVKTGHPCEKQQPKAALDGPVVPGVAKSKLQAADGFQWLAGGGENAREERKEGKEADNEGRPVGCDGQAEFTRRRG